MIVRRQMLESSPLHHTGRRAGRPRAPKITPMSMPQQTQQPVYGSRALGHKRNAVEIGAPQLTWAREG